MPTQTTISGKTGNHHKYRKQNSPNQNPIKTISIHKSGPTENMRKKTPNPKGQLEQRNEMK